MTLKSGRFDGCRWLVALVILVTVSLPVRAETYASVQQRRPDLFHPETGFRISRHRAPTPEDIPPPATVVSVEKAAVALSAGAIAVDVSGALQSRYDELEGTWLVRGPRDSLPGGVWLPEVGRGVLEPEIDSYLKDNLEQLTGGDRSRVILVFCNADCWMSWNAAQRIAKLGYSNVLWFPEGVDGWKETGRKLQAVLPVPVDVDQ